MLLKSYNQQLKIYTYNNIVIVYIKPYHIVSAGILVFVDKFGRKFNMTTNPELTLFDILVISEKK